MLFHNEHVLGTKEYWNEFIRAKADRIASVVQVLMVLLWVQKLLVERNVTIYNLYMVHKPRCLRRVARVAKLQMESKDS